MLSQTTYYVNILDLHWFIREKIIVPPHRDINKEPGMLGFLHFLLSFSSFFNKWFCFWMEISLILYIQHQLLTFSFWKVQSGKIHAKNMAMMLGDCNTFRSYARVWQIAILLGPMLEFRKLILTKTCWKERTVRTIYGQFPFVQRRLRSIGRDFDLAGSVF